MIIAMLGCPFMYLPCGKQPPILATNNSIQHIEADFALVLLLKLHRYPQLICESEEDVLGIDECHFFWFLLAATAGRRAGFYRSLNLREKQNAIVSLPDTVLGGRSLMYPFVEATLAPSECIGTIINSADG